MPSVTLKAFAKINLGLKVLGRRPDGFHELRTIYQSISLADGLEVSLATGAREVRLETSGFPVPTGQENLAVRAAEAVLGELKLRSRVLLRLQKRIPPGSGLGGASSDAAAVIRALVHLSRENLPAQRWLHLAADLGSDVPFFLWGGRALGIGRGEEVYPLPEGPRRWCVLLFPGQGMDTAEAYRILPTPLLTSPSTRHTIEWFCGLANIAGGDPVGNDFEPIVFSRFPQLLNAQKTLLRSGAEAASVTGSGAAVFALFRDPHQARRAAQRLRQTRQQVFVARTVSRREFQSQLPPPARRIKLGRRLVVSHMPLEHGT